MKLSICSHPTSRGFSYHIPHHQTKTSTCLGTASRDAVAPVSPRTGADKISLCFTTASTWPGGIGRDLNISRHLVDLLPGSRAVLKGGVLALKSLRNGRLVLRRHLGPVDGDRDGHGLAIRSVKMADRPDGVLPRLQLRTLLVLRVVAVAVVCKRNQLLT